MLMFYLKYIFCINLRVYKYLNDMKKKLYKETLNKKQQQKKSIVNNLINCKTR